MSTISKAEMLSQIVESGEKPFRIRFVKATGKEAGQVAEKVCYYGAPNPYPRDNGKPAPLVKTSRAKRKSYLESNSIPMTEFGTRNMVTPFISHIISFNGRQVIH